MANLSPITPPSRGGSGGSRIVWTDDQITPNLKALPDKVNRAVGLFMQYQSTKVQDSMRTNAPWRDRTGNARNGLFARYEGAGAFGGGFGGGSAEHAIVMYHTVPYGIWLEVRFSGKYRIIVPTLETEGPRVMAGINGLMGRML